MLIYPLNSKFRNFVNSKEFCLILVFRIKREAPVLKWLLTFVLMLEYSFLG